MIPTWIWPKNFWRRMFEWGPLGNCYGPQPSNIDPEVVEAYFGVRAKQIAHNLWQAGDWNVVLGSVQDVMEKLYRQLDVNHGKVA